MCVCLDNLNVCLFRHLECVFVWTTSMCVCLDNYNVCLFGQLECVFVWTT